MYLCIEGVIGVGKTTLTRMIARQLGAQMLLEVFDENPFLSGFYADRKRYAFQTQIFFLLSRYQQQSTVVPERLAAGDLVSDYTFGKDRLFAMINLEGDEMDTYMMVYSALAEKIAQPELVVYLRADTDTLMRRISMRDRVYERAMEVDYIDALRQAYDDVLLSQDAPRVLVVDSNTLDFVKHDDDFEAILAQVRAAMEGVYQQPLPL